MSTALAIFVKTPSLSPVKTRLAASLGSDRAVAFHQRAAAATASVVRQCQSALIPYWAIAESSPVAQAAWTGFAKICQGDGHLGQRLHHVYQQLQQRHGCVLLIGADSPQLTAALLHQALDTLAEAACPFVIGKAADGGFWLFGGRQPIDATTWLDVHYSRHDTAAQLCNALHLHGRIGRLPTLNDVDDATDLPILINALSALPAPLPEQLDLLDWLRALPATSVTTAGKG